ncbi:MAG TPA: hypothetical protein VHY57_00130 [Rhizomicrobium sp.]|jgi:hypothetical protein|nr:hypothetical protein [Rhizomicrobium sp.]
MWKTIALAVAVLAPTAVPGLLHAVKDAPQSQPSQPLGAVPAAGKSFAATCRGDQLLDSRPDPAWVGQSFAGDHCRAPSVPAAIDGTRSSRGQVVAAMARAKQYQVAATAFERCVSDYVAARHAGAPLTQAELVIENHRVLVSQRAKERAQAQANAAVEAFNEYGSECADHG